MNDPDFANLFQKYYTRHSMKKKRRPKIIKKGRFLRSCLILFSLLLSTFALPGSARAMDMAPQLLTLSLLRNGKDFYHATLTWEAKVGMKYRIYRRRIGGRYKYLDTIEAEKETADYTDHHMPSGSDYAYTVRSMDDSLFGSGLSRYDATGLVSLRGQTRFTCHYTNLSATLRWKRVAGADGYRIYRRFEGKGYRQIAEVDSKTRRYRDKYHNTMSKLQRSQYLLNDYYLDPSDTCINYTIKAFAWGSSLHKISLSSYDKAGNVHLNTPTLIRLKENKNGRGRLMFNRVPQADFYRVKVGRKSKNGIYHWDTVACLRQQDEAYLISNVPLDRKRPYYTVIAHKKLDQDREITSGFEKGFSIAHKIYQEKRILYVGDSITYGSPYKTQLTRYLYSYPWRIRELTGASYYNAAIPGATLSYSPLQTASFHRYRIATDVMPQLVLGQTPNTRIKGLLDKNTHPLEDFDVVILCAGTNDYTDLIPIGKKGDKTSETFCGALNEFFTSIRTANNLRKKKQKPPIKVVLPDLFYSDRTTRLDKRTDRFKTKNSIGYTLRDYQKAIDRMRKKYKKKGLLIYRYDTSHIVTRKNCPLSTADNLHLTKTTYARYGNKLSRYLIRHILK